jgi:hypothetical protein
VANLTTMEQAIAGSVARPRLRTLILGLFAALALVLAAVGLYGINRLLGGAAPPRDRHPHGAGRRPPRRAPPDPAALKAE